MLSGSSLDESDCSTEGALELTGQMADGGVLQMQPSKHGHSTSPALDLECDDLRWH
jgi:hypothetical protein